MKEQVFSMKEFQNPPAQYRGTPFWAWNTKVKEEELKGQIEQFEKMGMGGFYMHTRVGLDSPYLGEEYMKCVRKSLAIAKEKGLFCCLYDEDRWPSGYGGGFVTVNREYRSKYLLITPYKKGTRTYEIGEGDSQAASYPQGNGEFQAAYQVQLNADGSLKTYYLCEEEAKEIDDFSKWYVYLETAHDNPWFNNQAYVDTLNPKAIQKFIEVTYERYYKEVGQEFGKSIPTIFTDEPQFARKKNLGDAWNKEDIILPFTGDFAKSYKASYNENFFDFVPELLWELPDETLSIHRYCYHDHVTERFSKAFGTQVSDWCQAHGIMLTGHMMEEPTLESQTKAIGEVMRSMKDFSLPGVDMLCDAREYTTVKQASSLAHQYGREGVVSELYGVTNWDFDFRKHKLQGDWQAALGVTKRVHHLTWMSMSGEAKRDYPASIGKQSPWFEKYKKIEDHFARIYTALQGGKPMIKVGVIHPIESYWLLFGPNTQTSQKRRALEEKFKNITEWLLFHMVDFDYISESILPEQYKESNIGKMEYEVIIVPECITLRNTTLGILEGLKSSGKEIIFMGKRPKCMGDSIDNSIENLAKKCENIEFSENALLSALSPYRFLELRYHGRKYLKKPKHKKNWDGEETTKYIHQIRRQGEYLWIFIANGKVPENEDLVLVDNLRLKIRGRWSIQKYNTLEGEVEEVEYFHEHGNTMIDFSMYEQDSLLLRLIQTKETIEKKEENNQVINGEMQNLSFHSVRIKTEEPNVCVLDMAEYNFKGIWHKKEEILRIDNQLRKELGYPLRRAALAQPWVNNMEEIEETKLLLKYEIICKTDVAVSHIALEEAENIKIFLDGTEIEKQFDGCYVDLAIPKIKLPKWKQGTHEIQLEIPFSQKANLEACYLLGDFAVSVEGCACKLQVRDEQGFWGSITEQGFPFYGGNVRYVTETELKEGTYELQVSKFRAPLIQVIIDGKPVGEIFISPYTITFDIHETRMHRIELVSYGNRVNTFGTLHDCDEKEVYFDPNAWRTEKEEWAYEYQIKKCGILKAPLLRRVEKGNI